MAADDPTNELAHFSLGRSLMEYFEFEEASRSFRRTLEIRPDMTKAYHLLATCLENIGNLAEAKEFLTKGIIVADERGEMPHRAEMVRMLRSLGGEIPKSTKTHAPQTIGEGQLSCERCGQVADKMKEPPFRNKQGAIIQSKICEVCWKEWIQMGTKVINELRLSLADPAAQKIYDRHMFEFLNIEDAKDEKGT